jgi:CheY-like chemotaxis protein
MQVMIVTGRRDALLDLAQGLGEEVEWTASQAEVLGRAAKGPWKLVVADAMTPGVDYKAFLTELLRVNAMLNTVVVTDMDEETFHEDSEGLGVLGAVPALPVREDGEKVLARLKRILGLG